MPKYFNTTEGPIRYNEDGQVVAGGEWLELPRDTEEISIALERGELIKFDSKGKIVDNKEETTRSSE